MMRMVLCFALILNPGLATGQDPTIPSKDIVARLKADQPTAETLTAEPPPNFKLRAIVLKNSEQGTAILEAEGRRFRMPLDRQSIENRKTSMNSIRQTAGIQIRNNKFYVEDFSTTTIVLSDGVKQIFVQ